METKKRIRKTLMALIMAAALVAAGYGISPAVKGNDIPVPEVAKISETPWFRPTSAISQKKFGPEWSTSGGKDSEKRRIWSAFPFRTPFGDFFGPFSDENPIESRSSKG